MTEFFSKMTVAEFPRIPLEGYIDLTYRCNNNCLHCWLWIPPDSPEKKNELTFEEIKWIVEEARSMGCRRWGISGGEPMLRPDFIDIFEYILKRSASYALNTNGTLITPEIALLLKRPGFKMIALYGATAEVHDHITRTPGSFEAFLRGVAYLREASAGFVVQIIPMRDNYHQLQAMIGLAESLGSPWKFGALWLRLSASRNTEKNRDIIHQRLLPSEILKMDPPDFSYESRMNETDAAGCRRIERGGPLFSSCFAGRRDFHVDPYGGMSFCQFLKTPELRTDLRKTCFRDAWNVILPRLAARVEADDEYLKNCGGCARREDCLCCSVHGYLEHGRFGAKVEYLCSLAEENEKMRKTWMKNNFRYYRIAGITICVESDLPFEEKTYAPKLKAFEADGPGDDNVVIRHRFSLPDLHPHTLGIELYRRPPWAVYKKNNSWIYLGITPFADDKSYHIAAVFDKDYKRGTIYHSDAGNFRYGNIDALTFFPTDQILVAQLLASRQGCIFHAAGAILNGKGILFMGHSEAGKSTIVTMIKDKAEVLCDDRMIVRKEPGGFRIYGTWSHGDVPDVSPNSAPLRAICFLRKSTDNRIVPIRGKKTVVAGLLACLIKPLVTADWWNSMLSLVEELSREVPCNDCLFDKGGEIVDVLDAFTKQASYSEKAGQKAKHSGRK